MHMWPASMEIFVENTIKLKHNRKGLTLTQLVWAGCKESQFYSLPFGLAVASMY